MASARSPWATTKSPLIVRENGPWQGKGVGSWGIDSQVTKSHGTARMFDYKANNNGIHVRMRSQFNSGYCYQPEYTSCTQKWFGSNEVQSPSWGWSRWSGTHYLSYKLSTGGDYARGLFKVCETQKWDPDDCTDWTYRAHPRKY
ncbi:hypothetical protein SAMN06296429_103270 [Janibacter indicus]|uniref:Uncharacterized protein n=1 Tax=Janibacter indicus TaxID=857417 RepID=A0A1L3MEG3_9MICO|nr:hypothetical protein ASJ30_03425 [Janibacter indicus]SMC45447.1 hypothetical protein SAMN06296429_103270 [Janibacter indicus]